MSQETITINGKVYDLPKISYRTIVQLEDLGFEANKVQQKLFKSYAALVALTADVDIDEAADIIEEHCANGGHLSDLTPLLEHLAESDFFTKLLASETQQNK